MAEDKYTLARWWLEFENDLVKYFDGKVSDKNIKFEARKVDDQGAPVVNPQEHANISAEQSSDYYQSIKLMIDLAQCIEPNLLSAAGIGDKLEVIGSNFEGEGIEVEAPEAAKTTLKKAKDTAENCKAETRRFIKPVDKDSLLMSLLYLRHLERIERVQMDFAIDKTGLISGYATKRMGSERKLAEVNAGLLKKAIREFCLNKDNEHTVGEVKALLGSNNDLTEEEKSLLSPMKANDAFYKCFVEQIIKTEEAVSETQEQSKESVAPEVDKVIQTEAPVAKSKELSSRSLIDEFQESLDKLTAFREDLENFICLKKLDEYLRDVGKDSTRELTQSDLDNIIGCINRDLDAQQFIHKYCLLQGNEHVFSDLSKTPVTQEQLGFLLHLWNTVSNPICGWACTLGVMTEAKAPLETTLERMENLINTKTKEMEKSYSGFTADLLNNSTFEELESLLHQTNYLKARLAATISLLEKHQQQLDKAHNITETINSTFGWWRFSRFDRRKTIKCYLEGRNLVKSLKVIHQASMQNPSQTIDSKSIQDMFDQTKNQTTKINKRLFFMSSDKTQAEEDLGKIVELSEKGFRQQK